MGDNSIDPTEPSGATKQREEKCNRQIKNSGMQSVHAPISYTANPLFSTTIQWENRVNWLSQKPFRHVSSPSVFAFFFMKSLHIYSQSCPQTWEPLLHPLHPTRPNWNFSSCLQFRMIGFSIIGFLFLLFDDAFWLRRGSHRIRSLHIGIDAWFHFVEGKSTLGIFGILDGINP